MIRLEDVRIETGRSGDGSTFVRVIHTPSGISRLTIGDAREFKGKCLNDIESELRARGLTHFLVPDAEIDLPQSIQRSLPPFRYEDSLTNNPDWALAEGSRFFMEGGAVQQALRRIADRLKELGVPYAVAGAMALFRHGYRRFTEDVDILVSKEGLAQIHEQLEGRGYLPAFAGSRALRDTEHGVKIEFIVAGDYPGDGQPKPVVFPEPGKVAVELEGVRYVNLTAIIELKLASGMTAKHRLKDLADVQELIKSRHLPREFADKLNPYVRDKFNELWSGPERQS